MADTDPIKGFYVEHHTRLQAHYEEALEAASRDVAVVASGVPVPVAGDDQAFPFRVNPRFRQWVPTGDYTHSFVVVRPAHRPMLICYQPRDYWHAVAAAPAGDWTDRFDIVCVTTPADGIRELPDSESGYAFLGDPLATPEGTAPDAVNPAAMVALLDYQRVYKTEYEAECIRRANRIAVAGHLAARDAFRAGVSELDVHLAYLSASRQLERDLPYPNIVAFDEHGATLHYDCPDKGKPGEARSLLIDAGAAYFGYAADVTRTWSASEGQFGELIHRLDDAQQSLADRVAIGVSYVDLHMEMHLLIGGILAGTGLVTMSPEAMVEQSLTCAFFPHGLGHHLGLQVHDVGGKLADKRGAIIGQPEKHPFLRNLRFVEAGNVFTIEPGLYFIPQLLDPLRGSPAGAQVDWEKVAALTPYGGVRIEDDVYVTNRGVENLTRDAFLAMED